MRRATLSTLLLGAALCFAAVASPVFAQEDGADLSVSPAETARQFQQWLQQQGRSPDLYEQQSLFKNFQQNMHDARHFQAADRENGGTAEYGATRFSHMSRWEFENTVLQGGLPSELDDSKQTFRLPADNFTEPESLNWRESGAVFEPVPDQVMCGSCWAFSVAGAIEGAHFLTNEKRRGKQMATRVSVGQFVECDDHDYSCWGGWTHKALDWAMEQGGIVAEEHYPYSRSGGNILKTPCIANVTFNATCPSQRTKPCTNYCDVRCEIDTHSEPPSHPLLTKVISYDRLAQDEHEIMRYVARRGPVSVGINATPLQAYGRGIMSLGERLCNPMVINHAVLIVGYGSEIRGRFKKEKVDYWIVKNSWGSGWGEKGYFRLKRGAKTCGVHRIALGVHVEKQQHAKLLLA